MRGIRLRRGPAATTPRHRELRRRIPWMPSGAPAAAARQRKEGESMLWGGPQGQPQPQLGLGPGSGSGSNLGQPPTAPPPWTEAPVRERG